MFNLIVSGGGWQPHRDLFGSGRVLEYTNSDVVQRFMPNKILDINAVSKLPTLFMSETQGSGSQVAHVATITQLRLVRTDYQIEYATDSAIRPIPNASLTRMARELGIEDFEFSRTHWAIKDADLYKVLLRNLSSDLPTPKVFQLSPEPASDPMVSAMMPFSPGFDGVYAALGAAAAAVDKKCKRADDIWNHESIIQDVVSLICKSSVVICDLTGKNANVFYEAGIAHCLGKDVILITQSADDVPFDLRHLRYIQYLNNGEGLQQLTNKVAERLQTLADKN
ncbi:MAG: hypothetical protein ABIR35_06560 [Polaromonas sp.]